MTLQNLSFEYQKEKDRSRKRLGLIVLQTDETLEPEFKDYFRDSSHIFHYARIPSSAEVTSETLAKMADSMEETARLLPTTANFDVIGYACTSGATVIGEERVEALVQKSHPHAKVTTPLTALKAKLRSLSANKVSILTPYVPEVTTAITDHLRNEGFEIVALGSFNESSEAAVARISTSSTLDAAKNIASFAESDALFLSCTNLPTINLLEEAETETGRAVISSNSALAWHMNELARD